MKLHSQSRDGLCEIYGIWDMLLILIKLKIRNLVKNKMVKIKNAKN